MLGCRPPVTSRPPTSNKRRCRKGFGMKATTTWEAVRSGLEGALASSWTKSKIFSGAGPPAYGAEPNTQADGVTLGFPGGAAAGAQTAKPLRMAVTFGLAIRGRKWRSAAWFARKAHYFYPDLPKGLPDLRSTSCPIVGKGKARHRTG